MDLSQIRELLKIVSESGVSEVEIQEENFRMVVKIASNQEPVPYAPPPAMGYAAPPPAYPVVQVPPAAPAAAAPEAAAAPAQAPAPAAPSGTVVKAPIVGTYYQASSPEAAPFVQIGDKVKPGDVLCIIEAMKLMNEIESEVGGTVKEILVQNAEPVEYDQPLFVIDPA